MNQTTLSEVIRQCLLDTEIVEFLERPEEMDFATYEVAYQHLALCEECRQKLVALQPTDAMEQQLSYS